jgi:D-psicose/D-tagatose/L-ribulose 3-epimerase
MNFGVNCWVWGAPVTTDFVQTLAPHVTDLGYDVLEIPAEDLDALAAERLRNTLTDNGLAGTITAVMTDERDLVVNDDAIRANARQYIRGCIDVAAVIGSDRVVGPIYAATGRTWQMTSAEREQTIDELAEQLRKLAEYAESRGISLCIEPLNRFETSLINTVDQAISLISAVDHNACSILLDTFHINIEEEDFAEAIHSAGPSIGHFHACANDRGAPGNGHLPWESITAALDTVGYDSQVVVESFTPDIKSIARAASVWRPFEETQDRLASDGLAFLQSQFA